MQTNFILCQVNYFDNLILINLLEIVKRLNNLKCKICRIRGKRDNLFIVE